MEDDYMSFVKDRIELDKLLGTTRPEYHKQIKELLEKKHNIMKKNGFLAGIQINCINKKLEKIKKQSNTSK